MVKNNTKLFNRLSLAILLTLTGVFFVAPTSAQAAVSGIFDYTAIAGKVRIDGCAATCPAGLVIPATLKVGTKNLPVTSIGDAAFAYLNKLTSVNIPSSVTSIGDGAFLGNSLHSINIPSRVTVIRDYAFAGNKLTSVTIPSRVTSIGEAAFAENKLTSVTIPSSVTSIRDEAFSHNKLSAMRFIGNAPRASSNSFQWAMKNAKAYRHKSAKGFPRKGVKWNGLITAEW